MGDSLSNIDNLLLETYVINMQFFRHCRIEFDENFYVEWQFVYLTRAVLP